MGSIKRRTSVESLHEGNNDRKIKKLIQQWVVQQVENTSELRVFYPVSKRIYKVVFEIEIDDIHYIFMARI